MVASLRADERRTTFLISLDGRRGGEKTVAEVVKPDKGHVVLVQTCLRSKLAISPPRRSGNLSNLMYRDISGFGNLLVTEMLIVS